MKHFFGLMTPNWGMAAPTNSLIIYWQKKYFLNYWCAKQIHFDELQCHNTCALTIHWRKKYIHYSWCAKQINFDELQRQNTCACPYFTTFWSSNGAGNLFLEMFAKGQSFNNLLGHSMTSEVKGHVYKVVKKFVKISWIIHDLEALKVMISCWMNSWIKISMKVIH